MKDLLDIRIIPRDMEKNCNSSSCRLDGCPLAYSYVPYQTYETPYGKEKALMVGTIFPSLNKPFGVYGNEFKTKDGVLKL